MCIRDRSKANNKTVENEGSVSDFLTQVQDDKRRQDAISINELMTQITGQQPKMWGGSIVGFGRYHYKYESGREGDFMKIGFSPRKQNLSLYIMPGFDRYDDLLARLGKYKLGKSCLYIKRMEDVELDVLQELILKSYDHMTQKYG